MSIALSVFVYPSKKLQILAISFSIFLLFIGVYVFVLNTLPLAVRLFLSALCWMVGLFNYVQTRAYSKRWVDLALNDLGEFDIQINCSASQSEERKTKHRYRLATGSTLWPGILFLCLRRADGAGALNLVIPSDSLSKKSFRNLSLSCRWIVKHAQ